MTERETVITFHVARYDGRGMWLLGTRYQAVPKWDRASLPDQSVYARTYRAVMRKAIREFTPREEPIGRYTGLRSTVGRQVEVAVVRVEVNPCG